MDNTPNTSPVTFRAGQNFADVKALDKIKADEKAKPATDDLTAAIRERYTHYLHLERPTWSELFAAGEQVARFLAGQQFLMPNRLAPGGWIPYSVRDNNTIERRALSVMQYHIDGIHAKWEQSQPDITVRPGVESDGAREAAEGARVIVDHYEPIFYSKRAVQNECLEGNCFGNYVWRLYRDPGAMVPVGKRDEYGEEEAQVGPGYGQCTQCEFSNEAKAFTQVDEGSYQCPECGAPALVEVTKGKIPSLSNSQPVLVPDFRLKLIPFGALRWDLKYHADDSPWLIIHQRTTAGALRQSLGDVRIPGNPSQDPGLDVIDKLAYQGQAQAGYASGQGKKSTLYKEAVTYGEFWMGPEIYGDIRLPNEVTTVSGQRIPANVPFSDIFKGKTLCAALLNEGAALLGLYTEDHRDYVTQGKWYSRQGTGAGRGQEDLVEVQKNLNANHAQVNNFLRATGSPAMLVASEVLGEEGNSDYLGMPGQNIPIALAALAQGLKLSDVVAPAFTPGNVSGQLFDFTYNRLLEFGQYASHVMPFTGGLPGVNNKTATGAQISQASTDALFTAPLQLKAEVRQQIAQKLIRQYPKAFPVERYFPLGGKYGQHTGKWLKGADMDTELLFDVAPGSEQPRDTYRRRQDYLAVGELMAGMGGWQVVEQAMPERAADIVRTFDLNLQSDARNVAESLSFRRVRQMQAALKFTQDPMELVGVQMGTQVDPASGMSVPTGQLIPTGQGAIQPPVSPAEPSQGVMRQWLMEYLISDDGLAAPKPLRDAVVLLVQVHMANETMQQSAQSFAAGLVQTAQAAPGALGQQLMQPEQPQEDPNAQAQMQMEQEERAAEAQATENEYARGHDAAEADKDRDLEREKHAQSEETKLKVARLNAQGRQAA
jgi:hypothetical protein